MNAPLEKVRAQSLYRKTADKLLATVDDLVPVILSGAHYIRLDPPAGYKYPVAVKRTDTLCRSEPLQARSGENMPMRHRLQSVAAE